MTGAQAFLDCMTIQRASMKGDSMLNYAMIFLVLGAIAWSAYWIGVPQLPIEISWILSSIGILLVMISLVTGRTADKVL